MSIINQVSTSSGGTWSVDIVGKDTDSTTSSRPTISSTSEMTSNAYLVFNCSSILPTGATVTAISASIKMCAYKGSSTYEARYLLYNGTTPISDLGVTTSSDVSTIVNIDATSVPSSLSDIRIYFGCSNTSSRHFPYVYGAHVTLTYSTVSKKVCTITYNESVISTTKETENVDITYNGEKIATSVFGTKTLACDGTIMATDVIIGSKTLCCANLIMNGDVIVEVKKDSRLPEGYTELLYIKATTTLWINTLFTATNPKIEIKASEPIRSSNYGYWFGYYVTNTHWGLNTATSTSSLQCRVMGASASVSGYDPNNPHVIVMDTSKLTIDGTTSATFSTEWSGTMLYLGLFGTMNSSTTVYNRSRLGGLTCYYCKLWNGNTLVRDFVPAKNSSNVVGLFDLVNNTFFTNSGTGDFVEGPEVE